MELGTQIIEFVMMVHINLIQGIIGALLQIETRRIDISTARIWVEGTFPIFLKYLKLAWE